MKTKLRYPRAWFAFVALWCAPFSSNLYASHGIPDPIVVVTDGTWEVSGSQIKFTEYTLSAEQMPAKNAPLAGGSRRPVTAELFPGSRVIAGTEPIWATRKATDEWEAYHFRRLIDLGKYPIKSAMLIINCDDAARVYINQKPVTTEQPKPTAPEKVVETKIPEPTDTRMFDGENPVSGGKLHVGTVLELGHVYFKADDKFAMRLSQQRAKAVADVLVSQGVETERVTFKGYGKTQPKMNGTSKDANQLNQRVEVKITGL